jgi:hypothetical protein
MNALPREIFGLGAGLPSPWAEVSYAFGVARAGTPAPQCGTGVLARQVAENGLGKCPNPRRLRRVQIFQLTKSLNCRALFTLKRYKALLRPTPILKSTSSLSRPNCRSAACSSAAILRLIGANQSPYSLHRSQPWEGAQHPVAVCLNPISLPSRFLSGSIARKSLERFGSRDFRASTIEGCLWCFSS